MGGGYWGTWVVLWCGSVLGEVSFFFALYFLILWLIGLCYCSLSFA